MLFHSIVSDSFNYITQKRQVLTTTRGGFIIFTMIEDSIPTNSIFSVSLSSILTSFVTNLLQVLHSIFRNKKITYSIKSKQ